MDEKPPILEPKQEQEPPTPVTKRILAWVGVVYMLIIIALNFYMLSTASYIRGIAPLMLCPAVAGLGVNVVYRYRAGTARGGLPACIAMVALCVAALVLGLYLGIPALMENFTA